MSSKGLLLGRQNHNAVDTEGLREARYPSFKGWRRVSVSTTHHRPSTRARHIVHGQEDGCRTRREDRPFGGVVNVSNVPSDEMVASMNTRRALEWKAWLEKPRSINATVSGLSGALQQHGLRDKPTL